jgi:hypothetical protein
LGEEPPSQADAKAILTQGKVVIGNLAGEKGVLMAMRSNENDTNTAYDRAVTRNDVSSELALLLRANQEDERRHREWIESRLSGTETSTPAFVSDAPIATR